MGLRLCLVLDWFAFFLLRPTKCNSSIASVGFHRVQLDSLSSLVHCLTQVTDWLSSSYLVLHNKKTETINKAPPELQSVRPLLLFVQLQSPGFKILM